MYIYVKFGLVIYHEILFFICSWGATTTTVAKTFHKKCIQTVSKFIALIPGHHCQIINVNEFSWSWIVKDCIVSNFKKRVLENHCLAFIFSTKRKITQFCVVVILWQQRNVQKSVIQVQSCCFANLLLCRFCCHHCRCFLSSLLLQAMIDALQWQVKTTETSLSCLQILGSAVAFIIRYHLVRFFYDVEPH